MITVEFKDLNEMVEFARNLVGGFAAQAVEPVHRAQDIAAKGNTIPVTDQARPEQVSVPTQTPPVSTQMSSSGQTIPTTTTTYSLDEIANAAMTLMDSGRQTDLLGLLAQFGVEALPALPKDQYGAFATALRGLGAQI